MSFNDALSLFGGLALFLYGMHMMSDGLEDAAGNRMKSILEKSKVKLYLSLHVKTIYL